MVKRRTRSSSRADATLLACRFQGCVVSFATAAEQKKHETIHQADKPLKCDESGCNERFATSVDRQEHTGTAHARRRSKRRRSENRGDALALDEVQPQKNEYPGEKNGSDFVDSNVVQEADEIVENAVYLASQMKIARSYGIAGWGEEDFQNAHQWAVWVQNAVKEFSDISFLSSKLKQKHLHVEPLLNAERTFFDSVLGYEGLSSDVLGYIISPVSSAENEDTDEDQEKETFESLVAAIADAMDRKRNLSSLDGLLRDITAMIPPGTRPSCNLDPIVLEGERRHEVIAKAHVLWKRHNQLASSNMEQHLHNICDKLDEEMFEILANEARLACDFANKRGGAESSKKTLQHLFAFIRQEFEKNKESVLRRLDADILIDLCAHDCLLFDSYLSYLLEMHKELSSRSSDETLDLVKRGVVSLRQAATERVRNGSAQELDLEEIRARIRGLTKQRGTIGYMSKRIVEVYMSRQGMQSLDSPAGAP